MIEDLFKKNILIIVFLSIIYNQDNNYYITNNILPLELSKGSFGIKLISDNSKIFDTYFNHQTWLTNNLSIASYISPEFDNSIDIAYGFNVGYSSIIENQYLKNIIYAIGYHCKKYTENKFRLSDLSIKSTFKMNNENWVLLSANYLFNNKGNNQMKNYFSFDYMKLFKNNFIINPGIQLQNNNRLINYYIGFNYSL